MRPNDNIPLTRVFVLSEFLGLPAGDLIPAYWYGVTSIPGRMLGCHVMLENGANWARLPLHSFRHIETLGSVEPDPKDIQRWDCFGYDIQVIRFNFLRDQTSTILDLDLELSGRYLFTIDSVDPDGSSPFSEFPEQHKTFTVLACEDGTIRTRPNNMLRWTDPALYDTDKKLPAYKAQEKVFRSEN